MHLFIYNSTCQKVKNRRLQIAASLLLLSTLKLWNIYPMATEKSLVFTVMRRSPELITPAKPTPHEYKLLSDIDDQEGFRFQLPFIYFYKNQNNLVHIQKTDPVKVIREALSKTLVFYYPLAGRLREGAGRKLAVECTAEGVLFVEADADVTLEQFGDALQPPFPCFEELLFDVPGSTGILDCPLLLVQVTRLRCGGFIFGLRINHVMCDGAGIFQFMMALSEMARGASAPSILPVWQRELLNARDPPRVTRTHHEYDAGDETNRTITPLDKMVHRSFFFGATEILALHRMVPHHLIYKCSTSEVLTAFLWWCYTRSLRPNPEEEVRLFYNVNARSKFNPPLPRGYYGNAFAFPAAFMTAGKLCENPIGHTLEFVKQIKREVTEEYMRSVADLMVLNGRKSNSIVAQSFHVSDLTRVPFGDVDLGWGKPVYGGPARVGMGDRSVAICSYLSFKNKKGENGILVTVCLPSSVMANFGMELDSMWKNNGIFVIDNNRALHIKSAL